MAATTQGQTMADVPMLVVSANTSSERRISPSWTIAQFKARLEPITGVPSSAQRLVLRISGGRQDVAIESTDEDHVQLASFPLQAHAEVKVTDTRPPSAIPNYTDPSTVQKYEITKEEYESLPDTVLNWKKTQKLGRFAPNVDELLDSQVQSYAETIKTRDIAVSKRCRLLPADSDARRGEVAYIGPVPELPGPKPAEAIWVGVGLDEPVGRNDGSVPGGKRYFDAQGSKRGVFVRPERVECGDFPVVDEFADDEEDEDMEEI